MKPAALLDGRRVLVVEDQFLIAEDMCRAVSDLGGSVVGPVPRLAAALKLLEEDHAIDLAVLDINLDGETVFSAARELRRLSIPFIFATGYQASAIPPEFSQTPRLEKPVTAETLAGAIRGLEGQPQG